MRYLLLIAAILICPALQSASPLLSQSWSDRDIELLMAMSPVAEATAPVTNTGSVPLKNPRLGLVLSAAIPGAGEIYAGSWIKGAVFTAAEVLLWTGYSHYRSEGNSRDREFRAFANAHWSEQRYWVAMAGAASQIPGWEHLAGVDETNYRNYLDTENGLRTYEQTIGSHSLHRVKDQQYYEMIGKYDQFRAGWEDAAASPDKVTPQRKEYEDMEFATDSEYKKAGTCAMILLANHVVSAMDAVWSVNRFNHHLVIQPGMGIRPDGNTLVPMFSMYVSW